MEIVLIRVFFSSQCTHACNSLTYFEYELHATEMMWICWNLLKKIVKSIQTILFSADFSHSEPLSVSAEWSPKILEKRRWVRVVKNLSATGSCISPSFDLVTNIVAWFVLPKAAFSAQEYKKASRYASSKSRRFLGNCNLHCFS